MTYNIHPIFVHFPIALLTLYSIVRIIPLQKWFPRVSWKHVQFILLAVGVLGAFVALSTGEIAEHLVHPNRALVEAHSLFAATATWVYGLLLLGELLALCMPWIAMKVQLPEFITRTLRYIQKILTNRFVSIILTLVGLVTISVAGLLGGVMVYGTTADPFAGFILNVLGITI